MEDQILENGKGSVQDATCVRDRSTDPKLLLDCLLIRSGRLGRGRRV
nr:hypothetical protein [Mutagenesis vector pUTKm-MCS-Tac]